MIRMTDMAFSCESRYLNPLQVFVNDPRNTDLELFGADKVDTGHQKIQDLELGANKVGPTSHKKQDKIIAALKLLAFRERHVLVQFWSACEPGKDRLLTTTNQPFGLGVTDHVGLLRSYRKDSEGRSFSVDNDHEEEEDDCSPTSRVFGRGLPEWTSDLYNYTPKQFPQQEFAIHCNLHGYLALPVFDSADSATQLCVGVLELLTSSKYTSYAYEARQVHNALETVDLKTPPPFDGPTLNVPNDSRQNDFNKIYDILKKACDIHNLPLAQTWAMSQQSSYVSHEKVIQKSCSSFDTRCVGNICMSRAALPFYVRNLGMWPFLKASTERHLDSSHGFVGKALLSRGSCFCGDLAKLSEEEYPLVHYARMNRLSSCFAIFLRSVEANDDYVLEFFLPPDIKDSEQVLSLVQTLKQNTEIGSGFELGDSSCIQVVGPSTEVSKSLTIDPQTIQISSITAANNNKFDTVTSDSQSIMLNRANKTESSANVSNQWQSKQIYPRDDFIQQESNAVGASKNNKTISYPDVSMQKIRDNITDAGEKNNHSKQGRKPKIDSLTMEAVEKHVGKPIDEAAKSLGVSRSTLKRFCREHDMPSWPLPKHSKKTVQITDLKPPPEAQQNMQLRISSGAGKLAFVVIMVVKCKRWSCSIKRHGFSGKWWSCGRHRYNALHSADLPAVSEITAKPKYTANNIIPYARVVEPSLVHAPPKQAAANISDTKMVTVKATFKEDMIKFQLPTSSSLLELEHEVARRITLNCRRPRLKYRDEDNDLILLACDADLHQLLGFTGSHSTIKLAIMADN